MYDRLDDVCTHVTVILFWIQILVKVHTSKIVTDHKVYWTVSSNNTSSLQPQKLINIVSGLLI